MPHLPPPVLGPLFSAACCLWVRASACPSYGSGSFQICLNALALLFLVEVDDQIFSQLLPERMRKKIEEFGGFTLTPRQERDLFFSKVSHVVVITMGIAFGTGTQFGMGMSRFIYNSWVAFLSATLFMASMIEVYSFRDASTWLMLRALAILLGKFVVALLAATIVVWVFIGFSAGM